MACTVKKTLETALAYDSHLLVQVKDNHPGLLEACRLIACLVRVKRHTCRCVPGGLWQATEETAFYVCTAMLPATVLAEAIRGHWGIENRLHYVRDVSFREDHCLVRHQPGNLARLRTIAHNIIQHNHLPNIQPRLSSKTRSF